MSLVLLKTHGNRRSKLFYRGNDKMYNCAAWWAVEKEVGCRGRDRDRVRVGHIHLCECSGAPCMPILNKNSKMDL